MAPRSKRPTVGEAGAVWVSADLVLKLKGPQGARGFRLPQSPFLDLADQFLGDDADEAQSGRADPKPPIPVQTANAMPSVRNVKSPAYPKPPMLALPKPPPRPDPPRPAQRQVPKLPKRKP